MTYNHLAKMLKNSYLVKSLIKYNKNDLIPKHNIKICSFYWI